MKIREQLPLIYDFLETSEEFNRNNNEEYTLFIDGHRGNIYLVVDDIHCGEPIKYVYLMDVDFDYSSPGGKYYVRAIAKGPNYLDNHR